VFAEQILDVWVGPVYAQKSTLVFQIIAAGFLANAIAQIPASGLPSLGRPDLAAKFHLLELPGVILMNISRW
jgi:O-antigen/teichoic acid export membrane protein